MKRRISVLILAAALALGCAFGNAETADAGTGASAEAPLTETAEESTGTETADTGTGAETPEAEEAKPEAEEQTARDISAFCKYNGKPGGPKHRLNDGAYNNVFETGMKNGAHTLEIEVTEGEPIGALYIQWSRDPSAIAVQVPDGDGWRTIAETNADFNADYIALSETCMKCRLIGRDSPKTQLRICEMKVLTEGKPADDIQIWEKPDKVDMLLINGHPDDELLWFGGTIPYYAGERNKKILLVCCAYSVSNRRLEMMDALWYCGVRVHPIFLKRLDFSDELRKVLAKWHVEDEINVKIVEYIRRYRPEVLMLHDVNGEYGHGVHRAAHWLGTHCFPMAADPTAFPELTELYGTWQVKKVYVHLWPENQIHMDWKQPMKAFGGKTGLEVAQEALQFHKSQIQHGWAVQDGGDLDNALFGLYYSAVGEDIAKNDFFEHIPETPDGQ